MLVHAYTQLILAWPREPTKPVPCYEPLLHTCRIPFMMQWCRCYLTLLAWYVWVYNFLSLYNAIVSTLHFRIINIIDKYFSSRFCLRSALAIKCWLHRDHIRIIIYEQRSLCPKGELLCPLIGLHNGFYIFWLVNSSRSLFYFYQ